MKLTKRVQRTLMASAVAVLALGTTQALALGGPAFGTCNGGGNCTTAVGHASVSVASTLTINEQRAVSFGNIAVTADGSGSSLQLGLDGSRTLGGTEITLLNGGGGAGGEPGAQSPGHYTVEQAAEGGATQVYISFSNATGEFIDMCTPLGVCDDYNNGKQVELDGPGAGAEKFFVDKFVINESGNDVYGHYIDNTGGVNNPAPGTTDPFDHTHTAAADVDVVVGATLHTDTAHANGAYGKGKYEGTFNVMVSY